MIGKALLAVRGSLKEIKLLTRNFLAPVVSQLSGVDLLLSTALDTSSSNP